MSYLIKSGRYYVHSWTPAPAFGIRPVLTAHVDKAKRYDSRKKAEGLIDLYVPDGEITEV